MDAADRCLRDAGTRLAIVHASVGMIVEETSWQAEAVRGYRRQAQLCAAEIDRCVIAVEGEQEQLEAIRTQLWAIAAG